MEATAKTDEFIFADLDDWQLRMVLTSLIESRTKWAEFADRAIQLGSHGPAAAMTQLVADYDNLVGITHRQIERRQ